MIRTNIIIDVEGSETIHFDLVSELGDKLKDYVVLWINYVNDIENDITEENFCNFMKNYNIEVYPYETYENESLLICEHNYDNINGKLKCTKCGYEL